jgi:hypothetical protein
MSPRILSSQQLIMSTYPRGMHSPSRVAVVPPPPNAPNIVEDYCRNIQAEAQGSDEQN